MEKKYDKTSETYRDKDFFDSFRREEQKIEGRMRREKYKKENRDQNPENYKKNKDDF